MVKPLNERKFKFFISSDHKDKDAAIEIQQYLLNNYRGIQCHLETGIDLKSQSVKFEIIKLIRECDVYTLLMSQNSRSPKGWLKNYLREKHSEAINYSKKIKIIYLFLDDPNIFSPDFLKIIRKISEKSNYKKKVFEILPEDQELPINYNSLSSLLNEFGVQLIDNDVNIGNYDVFISYNFDDSNFAKEVYKLITAEGLKVFMSEISLPLLKQDEYRKQIVRAIEKSEHMVIVTSSRSNVTSKWVEYEWGLFLDELLAGRKKGNLLTVLAGNMEPMDLPLDIRNREAISFAGKEKILNYVSKKENEKHGLQKTEQTIYIAKSLKGESGITVNYGKDRIFEVRAIDLLSIKADSIVNPTNSGLSFGAGLADRISEEAGPELEDHRDKIIQKLGKLPLTFAVPSRAGWLPYKGIIHAVGPRMGDGNEQTKLEETIQNCLYVADKKKWNSVAFPAISTGLNGIPMEICASAFHSAVSAFFKKYKNTTVTHVILCLNEYNAESFEIFF